ncbi:DNA polymerase III beta subunit (EC [Olavius algarvensis associated proteobacterium Delta 3]|nr:DNA polymerase III beta subunit (EC [Olavius algarvensis associated proteobacterium Delta 3]CAB5145911.1 DNA polymerase III beta subunit (EC [Olavius algarvensis associated proteobacterium Delta 3]
MMKLTINKHDILDVLAKVQGLTGRKSNLAITENLLLRSGEERMTLTATDLESGFEGVYPANVEAEGLIAINAKTLYEIVRGLPSRELRIHEIENRWVEIGNQKVVYHIVGMNPDDFPDHPQIEDVPFFAIGSAAFKQMIEKTSFIAGAPNDKRAHINGIFIERIQEDGQNFLRMVSTDGSRLSLGNHEMENQPEFVPEGGMIIPKKGLMEVSKFLDAEGDVQIGYQDNKFIIKKSTENFIIRLLEGEFPKYGDIIIREGGTDLGLERAVFREMLKRMSILSSETYKGVIFNIREGNLEITATNPDRGESKEDMDIDYQGEPLQVAFNPRYFIDIMSVMENEKVQLNLIDDEKPCLIKGASENSFLSVIMPMRI